MPVELKILLLRRGITALELAHRAGCSRAWLYLVFQNRWPGVETRARAAAELGISVEELAGIIESASAAKTAA